MTTMMRITRRLFFGTALALAGAATGLSVASTIERCRARCTECSYVGPVHNDFPSACSDALRHQNATEHIARIEYLR
jgi:hypothetical protein